MVLKWWQSQSLQSNLSMHCLFFPFVWPSSFRQIAFLAFFCLYCCCCWPCEGEQKSVVGMTVSASFLPVSRNQCELANNFSISSHCSQQQNCPTELKDVSQERDKQPTNDSYFTSIELLRWNVYFIAKTKTS